MLSRTLLATAWFASSVQGQRNWEWFYENMCGCGETLNEGCGMTAKQLTELLTTSPVLKMCQDSKEGDAKATADWVKTDDEELKKRTTNECAARLHMHSLADKFGKCVEAGDSKEKCEQGENAKYCEFESQDKGKCGLDEEKLLEALLGDDLKDHPLLQHAVNMDKCSQLTSETCVTNPNCTYNAGWGGMGKCEGKIDLVFKSFLKRPALFELLRRANSEATCRGWHEHVWQGETCWRRMCHLERGICVANEGGIQDARPNKTSIQKMRDELCDSLPRGDQGECPLGCEYHPKKGRCGVKDGVVDDSASLELNDKDKKVALFYMVLRSATSVQESRCNHYDEDMDSCKKTYEEHDVCNGFWHPNATEIFSNWHGGGHHHHRRNRTEEAEDLINKTIDKVTNTDGGIGFNGAVGDLFKDIDKGEFASQVLDYFKSKHGEEKADELKNMLQNNTLTVGDLKDFIEARTATNKTEESGTAFFGKDGAVPANHFYASLAIGLLGIACGAFACGMWITGRKEPGQERLLQEPGYVRQGAADARELQHC